MQDERVSWDSLRVVRMLEYLATEGKEWFSWPYNDWPNWAQVEWIQINKSNRQVYHLFIFFYVNGLPIDMCRTWCLMCDAQGPHPLLSTAGAGDKGRRLLGPTEKEIYRVNQLAKDAKDGFLIAETYRTGQPRPKIKVLVFDGVRRETRAGKIMWGKYEYI